MKSKLFVILIVAVFSIFAMSSYAAEAGKPVIPYGDYCIKMNRYGGQAQMLDSKSAAHALHHYFHKKGMDVQIIDERSRFIKAHVFDQDRLVDTILFDRRTGRIRSIY